MGDRSPAIVFACCGPTTVCAFDRTRVYQQLYSTTDCSTVHSYGLQAYTLGTTTAAINFLMRKQPHVVQHVPRRQLSSKISSESESS